MIGQAIQRDMLLRGERRAADADMRAMSARYEDTLEQERRAHEQTKRNLLATGRKGQAIVDEVAAERDAALEQVEALRAQVAALTADRDALLIEVEAHETAVRAMAAVDPHNPWFAAHPHYVDQEGRPMSAYATQVSRHWHARREAEYPHVDAEYMDRAVERGGADTRTDSVPHQAA